MDCFSWRFWPQAVGSLLVRRLQRYPTIGETCILGDSPLVLLTVLQSPFEANPLSNSYA
jgi:hypothetical protein